MDRPLISSSIEPKFSDFSIYDDVTGGTPKAEGMEEICEDFSDSKRVARPKQTIETRLSVN